MPPAPNATKPLTFNAPLQAAIVLVGSALVAWGLFVGLRSSDAGRGLQIAGAGAGALLVGLLQWLAVRRSTARVAALEKRLERYHNLFANAPEALLMLDAAGETIWEANRRAGLLLSRDPAALLGVRLSALFTQGEGLDSQGLTPLCRLQSHEPHRCHLVRPDGVAVPVEITPGTTVEIGGRQVMISVLRDMTEHRRQEEARQASAERFRASFEQAAVGMAHIGLDGRFLLLNHRFCSIVGYDSAELLALTFRDITHPDDLAADTAQVTQLLAGALPTYTMEKRYIRKDGKLTWANLTVSLLRTAAGEPWQFLAVVEDINTRKLSEALIRELNTSLELRVAARTAELTRINLQLQDEIAERNRVEQSLREREEQYRTLVEQSLQGVAILQQGALVFANAAIAELTGYTVGALTTMAFESILAMVHPDDRVELAGRIDGRLRGDLLPNPVQVRFVHRDGSVRWVTLAVGMIGYRGEPALQAVAVDITALKEAEMALRASRDALDVTNSDLSRNLRLLETIADTTPESLVVFDLSSAQPVYVNRAARELYGMAPGELRVVRRAQVAHPDDLPMLDQQHRRLASLADGEVLLAEYRLRAGTDSWRWVQSRRVVLNRDPDGRPHHILSVTSDITNLKLAEEQVRSINADLTHANADLTRALRLKDEFLANMSHELRTPLNNVLGRVEALQDAIYGPVTDRQHWALGSIGESGRHLLALITDILDLSKIEAEQLALERKPVPVAELCHSALRLVAALAAARQIRVSIVLDPRLETVEGDQLRLKQILINLLSNAVKFTPPGGAVGLETQGDPVGGSARFVVWDTGIGIAVEQQHLLFQPFVQLQGGLSRSYEGTGLGLALVDRLVRLHHGSVSVESALGVGSRFTVTVPWRG